MIENTQEKPPVILPETETETEEVSMENIGEVLSKLESSEDPLVQGFATLLKTFL